MATTIITKNGSGAPLAGDLTAGELAVDLTNKRLYSKDSGGTVIELGTTPSSFTSVGIDDNATSTAITIDASENVGIGTSPSAPLHLSGADTELVRLAGTNAQLRMYSDADGFFRLDNVATGKFKISGAGTDHVTIDSSGNVGIGDSSPDAGLTVHSNAGAVVATSNIARQTYTGVGNFQVSTANSGGILIHTENTASSGFLGFGDGAVAGRIEYQHSVDKMTFMAGASTRMTIDSTGNVGIGTSSPTSILHIQQPVDQSGLTFSHASRDNEWELELSGANSENFAFKRRLENDTDSTYYLFGTSGHFWYGGATGSTSERMRLDSSGNLLVGKTSATYATPGAQIEANGTAAFTRDSFYPLLLNRETSGGGMIQFYINDVASGQITTTSGGTPAFASGSDARLKENVADHAPELPNIMSIQIRTWDWKDGRGGGTGEGVVA